MDSQPRRLQVVGSAPHDALEALSDEQLMQLARGTQEPFRVLVRRHQTRVLHLTMRYLHDKALAADVAQNTFLELFRSRLRYQARGKFVPYLCQIAINQCRMAKRKRVPGAAVTDEHSMDKLSVAPVECEQRRELELAVGRLSEKLRVVVVLRFAGQLEIAEIAETLNVPVGTVKRRLFDAMTKLREQLEEHYE